MVVANTTPQTSVSGASSPIFSSTRIRFKMPCVLIQYGKSQFGVAFSLLTAPLLAESVLEMLSIQQRNKRRNRGDVTKRNAFMVFKFKKFNHVFRRVRLLFRRFLRRSLHPSTTQFIALSSAIRRVIRETC